MSDSLRPHELQHARPPCPSPTPSLLKLMSMELVMPSNHLILCRPLLLPPSIFPSIRVFSSELVLHIRWPKYWSFSFSISPSNEHPELISFSMDWLDLLAAQGTLKSLLQPHSSEASIVRCSAFFTVMVTREQEVGGTDWEADTHTPLSVKQTPKKTLLYSTGNSTQHSVMAYMGK